MHTNVVNKKKKDEKVRLLLKMLNSAMTNCIGPWGSTTIIQGRSVDEHMMTKDGKTILDHIHVNDPIADTFLRFIRTAADTLVTEVGDGSTSTVVAAHYIYEKLYEMLKDIDVVRPKLILDTINEIIAALEIKLQKKATRITSDNIDIIGNIASVSLNNNEKIGDMIKEIYKEIGLSGFITVKLANSVETHYVKSEGFQLDAGMLDKTCANKNAESVLVDNAILMFDAIVSEESDIRSIFALLEEINSKNAKKEYCKYKSLTVIAPGYSAFCKKHMNSINVKYERAGVEKNFNFIEYSIATGHDKDIYTDLAVMLGASIIRNSIDEDVISGEKKIETLSFMDQCGYAQNTISTNKVTTFKNTNVNELLHKQTIEVIEQELKSLKQDDIIDIAREYSLNKRLAILRKNLVTIFVGGNTEAERIANKHLVDDAVAACRSALKYGYVIGGNLSIVQCCDEILKEDILIINEIDDNNVVGRDLTSTDKEVVTAIREAFVNVYREVLNKSAKSKTEIDEIIEKSIETNSIYDLTTDTYGTDKVINSVKTEIEILKNVVNIISLILTSNQFLEINANNEFIDEE